MWAQYLHNQARADTELVLSFVCWFAECIDCLVWDIRQCEPVAWSFLSSFGTESCASRLLVRNEISVCSLASNYAYLHEKSGPLIAGVSGRQSISRESGYIESQNKKKRAKLAILKSQASRRRDPLHNSRQSAWCFGRRSGDLGILHDHIG